MISDYNKIYLHYNPLMLTALLLAVLLPAGLTAAWATGGAASVTGSGSASSDAAYAGLSEASIAAMRKDFTAAVESMEATDQAIRFMDAQFPRERALWPPLARAYRASLEGLIGKHSPKLLEKFNRVNAAIADYEGLIEAYPEALELRFMRFAFYSQLPGIFGVGKYVAPDRAILTDQLEQGQDKRVPDSQKLEMISWILKDGKPDRTQTARLKAAAARLDQP
jgi:hypothetical protein